ncbi:MAG: type II secretion system protein GspL [Idiomarina sp.]|nr:type II secretion system protein GspL [Idiomarina sp.]
MIKQLIIRLSGQADGNIPWLLWQAPDASAGEHGGDILQHGVLSHANELSELLELSEGAKVTVLVSSTEIGFHQLDLPPGSRRHLAQVVPYALEEELAQDINELHFAWQLSGWQNTERDIGDESERGLPVCVVAKSQMQAWQDWLDASGLKYAAIIPDLFILPLSENEWSAMSLDDDIIVRHSAWRGFAIEQSLFEDLSELFSDALTPPALIRCWGEVHWPHAPAQLAAPDDQHMSAVNDESAINAEPNGALTLARRLQPQTSINLLQGEFAQKRKRKANLGVWRWPAIAAAVLLGLLFVDKGLYIWQLNQQHSEVVQSIENRYRQTFPDETRVVNVRAQLNQHLARLQGGGDSTQVLGLLQQLAPAFNGTDLEVTLMQFDAGRNELRLQATGANFAVFERFGELAQQQALEVEQGQLNSRAGRIAGTLIVRGGS